jgi:outer membrane receptor for ferrienterochelin and colicins
MQKILFFVLLPFVLVAQKSDTSGIKICEYVCTAQTVPTDIRQAVHAVKVINEQVIARRAANNVEELLQGETNFRFSSDLILGSGIQMNGVGGENIKILIDGVPVIGRLNGNVDLSQIPLYNVLRVEIVQGSLSAVYGSNASGGVINIITKKTQVKPAEVEFKAQQESVGIKTFALQGGFQKKKLLLRLGVNIYDFTIVPADSLRTSLWNPKEQWSAQSTLKYRINDNNAVSYTYNLLDETVNNYGTIQRPKFKPYAFDDTYKTIRNDHTLNFDGQIRKINVQSTIAFNQFYRQKNTYRTAITENTNELAEGQQDTSRFNAVIWRNTFSKSVSKNFTLIGGAEFYYENAHGKKINDSSEVRKNFAQIADIAAFTGVKINLYSGKLTIQPTVRYAYNTKFTAPLTPSLNALYNINDAWKIRTGYARGFRAPSLKELYFNFIDINHYIVGFEDMKAEKSHNLSLNPSYTGSYKKTSINIEGNLFYNYIKNRIILAQISGELLKYRYDNLAEYKTKGAGATVTLNYDEKIILKTSAVYTGYYNTARDEKPDLRPYLYSPELSVDFTYMPKSIPLTFNVLYRHTGSIPTFNLGKNNIVEEDALQGWDLLNAMVSAHFFKNKIQISTGVKNILDIKTINTRGSLEPGHNSAAGVIPVNFGRSVVVKIGLKLG